VFSPKLGIIAKPLIVDFFKRVVSQRLQQSLSLGANYATLLSLIQNRQIFEIDSEMFRLESSAEAISRRLGELKTKREERLKELDTMTSIRRSKFDTCDRLPPNWSHKTQTMRDNTKIITIDAQILRLRKEIDAAPDKTLEAIVAKQLEVDRLIAARYALLLKMQNWTSDTPQQS
jgi:hypothetical protein